MKKLVGILTSLVALLLLFLGGFNFFYKVDGKDFIKKNTVLVFFNNNTKEDNEKANNLYRKIIDSCTDENLKNRLKLEYENIEKNNWKYENIKTTVVVNMDTKISKGAIVDPGYKYFLFLTKINKYFTKLDSGIYKLKEDILPSSYQLPKINIYLKPYRGVFVVAFSEEDIFELINSTNFKTKNEEIITLLDKNKSKDIGICTVEDIPFLKELKTGIKTLLWMGDFKGNNKIDSKFIVFFDKKEVDLKPFEGERVLDKNVDVNDLYISFENMDIIKKLIRKYKVYGGEYLEQEIKEQLGRVTLDAVLADTKEILMSVDKKSAILKLSENSGIGKILETQGIKNNDYEIKIENDMIIVGNGIDLTREGSVDVPKEDSLYLKFDFGKGKAKELLENEGITFEENQLVVTWEIKNNQVEMDIEVQEEAIIKIFVKLLEDKTK